MENRAKIYLGQLYRIEKNLENKRYEMYQLNELMTSITSVAYGDKVQTSGSHDPIGNSLTRIEEMKERLSEATNRYISLKYDIIKQIESLDKAEYYNILHERYVKHKTFDQIAEDSGYSWRQIMRLHNQSLIAFENKYKDVIECHIKSTIQ